MILSLLILQQYFRYTNTKCTTLNDEHHFELSIGERFDLNMNDNFIGSNLRFSLVGSHSRQFTVQQRLHFVAIQPLMEDYVIIKQWGELLALLRGTQQQYYIQYGMCDFQQAPAFENIIQLLPRGNCVDLIQDTLSSFVVLCVEQTLYYLQYVQVDGQIQEFQYQMKQKPKKFMINMVNGVVIVIQVADECIIDTYYQQKAGMQLNAQTLSQLTMQQVENFSINDITVKADQIIIAHQISHMIYLTIQIQNDQPIFTLVKLGRFQFDLLKISAYLDNYLNLIVVALIPDNRLYFIETNKQYQLDSQINLKKANLQASSTYCSIHDGKSLIIYKFSDGLKTLMFQEDLDLIQYIFNPDLNDLIIVQERQISRFILSDGYLILIPPKEIIKTPVEFSVVASSDLMECEARVSYIVTSSVNSQLLKPYSYPNPYPNIIFFPKFPSIYSLNQVSISGPNQKMLVTVKENDWQLINIITDYKKVIPISGLNEKRLKLASINVEINKLIPTKIHFILQYYQNQQLYTEFLSCEFNKQQLKINCDKEYIIDLDNVITQDQIFYSYDLEDNEVFIYVVNKNEVIIYKWFVNQLILQNRVQLANESKQHIQSSISQIIQVNNLLVILRGEVVYLIQIFGDDQFRIDEAFLQQKNYLTEFKPSQVKVSQIWNLIFIVNGGDILVIQCYEICDLVNKIVIQNAMSLQIQIQMEKVLIVLAEIESELSLMEYLIKDPHYIVYQKKLQTYHFWLQKQMLNNYQDDEFYVFAYSPVLKQRVILIYKVFVELRDSLLTMINVGEDNQESLCSVSGINQKLMYIHMDKSDLIYLLTNDLRSTINVDNKSDSLFIHQLQVESSFFNIDYPLQQKYHQTIKFVDLKTIIYKNVDQIEFKITEDIQIPIDNSFFTGLITNLRAENAHLDIQKSVQLTENKRSFKSDVINTCQIDEITVILTHKTIEFMYSNFQDYFESLDITDLKAELGNVFCSSHITKLIAFRYLNITGQYIQFIQCTQQKCSKQGNPQLMKEDEYIFSLMIINSTLITLSKDTKYNQALLNVYDIKRNEFQISLYQTEKIDKQRANQDFNIKYISMQSYQVNGIMIYKLFLTEMSNGLLYVDMAQEKYMQIKSNVINLNLQTLLQSNGLFEVDDQIYISTLSTQDPKDFHIEGYTEFYLLIITANSLHYGLIVQFKGSKLSETSIAYLLHTHQLWNVVTFSQIKQSYLALGYIVPDKQELMVAIYKIPANISTNLKSSPVLVHGAINIQLDRNLNQLIFLLENEGQDVLLYFKDKDPNIIYQAKIYNSSYLIINSSVKNHEFTLVASNYYYENSIQIVILNQVKKGGFGVMVLLILVGCIIVLGLLAYLFFRIRSKDQVVNTITLLE
ncbi:unnamed protein product (macronuclear) [Paramecium tetraurelia]|uniref:Transmembrane protein n=1 Tax=Paramecium tetraurelia TaxID=5888 RepID=A0DLT1_PARTE|nr:uncharacterized protein GSPATT00039630001 [Paramecium tetraurelia]CAK83998.1 unnamed protein product [Paramecium tetraurelia]|eukprot:XP_001451395.1 hypothetical protein (macronuclear) [Paramecium tetraurelia strain d4-2]